MAEIETKLASVRGYKATVTRTVNVIKNVFLPAKVSSSTLDKCRDYRNELDKHFQKLTDAIQELCELDPNSAEKTLVNLDEYEQKYSEVYRLLLDREASVEEDLVNRTISSGNSNNSSENSKDSSCIISKVDKLLRPFTISTDHTPQDLRRWNKKFRQYFASGNVASQPLDIQQAYFEACVDDVILNNITEFITPTTPIFGVGGCIDQVNECFKTLYPLFNRRYDYFHTFPTRGEDALSFYSRLRLACVEADSKKLDADQLFIFLFLAHYPDDKIREKASEIDDIKLADFYNIVERRVRFLKTSGVENNGKSQSQPVAAVNDSDEDHVVAEIKTRPTQSAFTSRKENNNRFNRRRDDNGRSGSSTRRFGDPKLSSKCTRCNNTGHSSDQCQTDYSDLLCRRCNKRGHLQKNCRVIVGKTRVGAINEGSSPSDDDEITEVTPRLPLTLIHASGNFNFKSFPDCGSCCSIIAANLTTKFGLTVIPENRK